MYRRIDVSKAIYIQRLRINDYFSSVCQSTSVPTSTLYESSMVAPPRHRA